MLGTMPVQCQCNSAPTTAQCQDSSARMPISKRTCGRRQLPTSRRSHPAIHLQHKPPQPTHPRLPMQTPPSAYVVSWADAFKLCNSTRVLRNRSRRPGATTRLSLCCSRASSPTIVRCAWCEAQSLTTRPFEIVCIRVYPKHRSSNSSGFPKPPGSPSMPLLLTHIFQYSTT